MRPTLDRTGTRVQFAAGGAHYSLAWDQDSAAPLGADAATLDLFAAALADAGMTAPDPYEAPPAPVPAITKAQCLLWLRQLGKTEADIDAFIAAKPDEADREVARIEWRHRPVFRHDHPLIGEAADEFGIPRDYLPDAFRAAALL